MELQSKVQLGGAVGDTCGRAYLNKVFADGSYGWLNDCIFDFQFGGQFLLDPNETNGWGNQGATDDTNVLKLADATSEAWSYLSGGVQYDHDVEIIRLSAEHRNNNAGVLAWGWCLGVIERTPGTNTVASSTMALHEVNENNGVGPRDYASVVMQETDIELAGRSTSIVKAGHTICLAVSSPTAETTNRYVQVTNGRIVMRKL